MSAVKNNKVRERLRQQLAVLLSNPSDWAPAADVADIIKVSQSRLNAAAKARQIPSLLDEGQYGVFVSISKARTFFFGDVIKEQKKEKERLSKELFDNLSLEQLQEIKAIFKGKG